MTTTLPSDEPALMASLRATATFAGVSDDVLRELSSRMTVLSLGDGDVLIHQGANCDELYVVLSGALNTSAVDARGMTHTLGEVEPGKIVGGISVFSATPAPATFRAIGPARLGVLSKAGYVGFSEASPSGALSVVDAVRPLLRRHRLWVALHVSRMFREVDQPALMDLQSEFELIPLYGGEVLFRQGDTGDTLYIVVNGRLRVVTHDAEGEERVLAELGTGETVGEMAVISGEPRSATVYAIRDTTLAMLSRASVDRVIDRHPRSMLNMLTGRLVSRLRAASSGERRRTAIRTVALVAASGDVPLPEFADKLAAALSRLGQTLHLSSARVDSQSGRPGAAQAHDREGGGTGLVEWIAEQEIENRYVLYEADRSLSPWTERCVRQADRIVLVANASGEPVAGEVEAELLTNETVRRTPVTLALVHTDETTAPTGTARWLAGRTLERHLHVRRSAAADYDRVARFLTGNTIGLALGGGFARGLAHLGVLRALGELNIPVDTIGGSSMGAMVGAHWVLGWDNTRIIRELSSGFADSFDDMTIPFLAFKRGGKMSKLLRQQFQGACIEDLWIPYFCVSANLNRSEVKVHTTGDVARAVLASARAPGIFPPMVFDGELHVDGGLINNVPVDIMKTFSNDGLVIGVDVSPPHELNVVEDYGEDVSGWRAIWRRFNPTREKRIYHPSILLVLMRIIEFGGISYRKQKAELADLYISPDVLRFNRNDFASAAQLVESGYDASRGKLREWLDGAGQDFRSRRPDLFARSVNPDLIGRTRTTD